MLMMLNRMTVTFFNRQMIDYLCSRFGWRFLLRWLEDPSGKKIIGNKVYV